MGSCKFVKGKFTEAEFEKAVIELFQKRGYGYVHGENIHRQYSDILLKDDLRQFLCARYANEDITDNEIERAINRLDLLSNPDLYEAAKETHRLVSEGFNLKRDDPNKNALYIEFIDFDNADSNNFKVINQYKVEYGNHEHRIPDLLVFINGIPVTIFEFKTIIREDKKLVEGQKQICNRYAWDIPHLLRYCSIAVISDGANSRVGTPFTDYPHFFSWNKVNDNDDKEQYGIGEIYTLLDGAFAKERLLAILRDFVFYPDTSSKNVAIVCRYPQFFATNKLLASIKAHLKPHGDGKGGTYYGTTGCGKTYTMIYLARQLMCRDNATFGNPTILIIVDRSDLDSQTSELFENAKIFLHDDMVRSIESREDLGTTLANQKSGGVFVMTVQKFCENTGLLCDRSNVIVMSDEAHRSQLNTEAKDIVKEGKVVTKHGYAECLRKSFPNATFCGFTGTPIDETYAVFGGEVDRYTMDESVADGITTEIAYQSRLARLKLSQEKAKDIQKYYDECEALGSTPEQVEESKRDMSKMRGLIADPERLQAVAEDIVAHYDDMCEKAPEVVKKAMIVCYDREIAYDLYQRIKALREDWTVPRKTERVGLSEDELQKLVELPKLNLVATVDKDDTPELKKAFGNDAHRELLRTQFKDENSNFRVAIVVDMWTTGFDVDPLAVMYIDKPLQKHTLIQTISRVNRVYEGKTRGLIIDYIGIETDMKQALKEAGNNRNPIKEISATLCVFRTHLEYLDKQMSDFDARKYYTGEPEERFICLREAAEFVQRTEQRTNDFMSDTRILRNAYDICAPSGELTEEEDAKAQFYLAVRSIIYKQTKPNVPDTEIMNRHVEQMIKEALSVDGAVELVDEGKLQLLTSQQFKTDIQAVKLPVSRFQLLLKLLRQSISNYRKKNRVKAIEFDKRLNEIVERYNNRGLSAEKTSEVVSEFVDKLSDELLKLQDDIEKDERKFDELGITSDEKAYYDIIVSISNEHGFEYPDDKTKLLAKEIKRIIDEKSKYADWSTREDIKNDIYSELINVLYNYEYPLAWEEEVYRQVMAQAETIING